MKNIQVLLSEVLKQHEDKIEFAYLFGSMARNDVYPLSDIDIAIYLSDNKDKFFDRALQIHADLCRTLKRDDVDILVINRTRNIILLEQIVREGVIVLDKNPSLREDFELKIIHQAIDFRTQRKAVMGI